MTPGGLPSLSGDREAWSMVCDDDATDELSFPDKHAVGAIPGLSFTV